jgi:hypothetical protein
MSMSKATDTDGRHWLQPSGNISPRMTPTKQAIRPCLNVKRHARGVVSLPTHLAREGRMTVTIGRRELLAALGGAVVAWPLAASALSGIRATCFNVRT